MAGTFTKQNLYDDAKRDAGSITNIARIANRAAIFVVSDVDLRSTKRMAYLSPGLNENQYDYQGPADMKELGIIDVRRIEGRKVSDKFNLVTSEYFDREKINNKNLICVEDRDFLKKLRISADTREESGREVVIHDCESLTTDGTWSVSLDASNLTLDTDNFLHGEASLNFDMDQAGTTTVAGYIQNSDFDAADLSDFETGGSVFVWVYIPGTIPGSVVDNDLLGFTLGIGSDASNYFSKQVTVTNENLTFYPGWNLLRFDFASATETGTVDMDNIDYVRLAIDRAADGGSLASTDWRLDYIVARRGKQHEVWYYTKYPWQTSAAVYLEESTAATDKLNADTEEYELFVLKLKEYIALDKEEFDAASGYNKLYEAKKANYITKYPSERLLLIHQNYNFWSNVGESWLNK